MYACFLLSEERNQKQEMLIHMNRIYEWENAKNQRSQAKIFLLRSSGRTDELYLVYSEKTDALMVLGINPYKF